jgi:hypothetical protein
MSVLLFILRHPIRLPFNNGAPGVVLFCTWLNSGGWEGASGIRKILVLCFLLGFRSSFSIWLAMAELDMGYVLIGIIAVGAVIYLIKV